MFNSMKKSALVRAAAIVAVGCFSCLQAHAEPAPKPGACTISLHPSKPSPQLVGERIIWTATAANCGTAPVYQFNVAAENESQDAGIFEELNTARDDSGRDSSANSVRDFSLDPTFAWAPMQEGRYLVTVRAKAAFNVKNATRATTLDEVSSRATGSDAIVTATLNPLVALYSAPPCKRGTISVQFRPADDLNDSHWMSTNTLHCVPGKSRNFLVAGMLANTPYQMRHVVEVQSPDDRSQPSRPTAAPLQSFTTGVPPTSLNFPQFTVRQAPGPDSDLTQNTIYHNLAGRPQPNAVNLLATDLSGRLEWYYDPLHSGLVAIGLPGSNLVPGGTVLFGGRDRHRKMGLNVLREVDLAGNPLRETNIDAVNSQLPARGRGIIYGFHHEMLRLPNGDTATLGWNLRTVDIKGKPTPYAGDMLLVLDKDFQVVWTWDAFDHLDFKRGPRLGDDCTAPCPIPGAVDWLHENAIAWSEDDGNFLISVRHQSWVIKIDYSDGDGDGHILWRLGAGGDFTTNSTDPHPWFSYEHYPHYLNSSTMLLFDNGNERRDIDPNAHSRGQLWGLDEEALTATPLLNLDLGNYSDSLGTAQMLHNGNFAFDSGSQDGPLGQFGQSIEVTPDGTKTYVLEVAARDYRALRTHGLYRGVRR